MKTIALVIVCLLSSNLYSQKTDSMLVFAQIDSFLVQNIEFRKSGEFTKAIECLDSAKFLIEELVGFEDIRNAKILVVKADTYHAMGDFDKAKECCLNALTFYEKKENSGSIGHANLLNTYGYLLVGREEYEESESVFRLAEKMFKGLNDIESDHYASLANHLGTLFFKTGRIDSAAVYWHIATAVWKENHGVESRFYAAGLHNLGNLFNSKSDFKNAEKYYSKTLEIKKVVLPVNSPQLGVTYLSLASAQTQLGQYDLAEENYLEALSIFKNSIGEAHPYFLFCTNNMALFYGTQGNQKKAFELQKRTLALQEKHYGRNTIRYGDFSYNLADSYAKVDSVEKSIPYYQEAIRIQQEFAPADITGLARFKIGYASALKKQFQYAVAIDSLERIIRVLEQNELTETWSYFVAISEMADISYELDDYDQSLNLFLQCKELLPKIKLIRNREYSRVLFQIARSYSKLMNEDQAAKYFEEALELDRELLLDASKYLSEIEMNGYISWFHVSQEKFLGSSKNISLSGNMAYDNALFYKGFLMQEVSKIKNLSQHDTLSTLLYDNLKALRHQLAGEYSKPLAEQSNIIELEENAQIAEKELVKNVANLDQTLKQFKWTDIKNSLQPREAAIEFIAYRDNDKVLNDMVYYEALLITAKSEKVERIFLFVESELEGIFENSQESTASINRLYSNKLKDGKEKTLANLVYSPLQNHLMNVETIYYSVEGLLHKLNFDAIQLESNILLGEKYMLNRLGSTKHITSLKSNESISVSSASLFGGISYDLNIQTTEYFKEIPEQSNQTQKSIQVEQSILRSMRSGIDVSNVDTLNFSKTWQELKWTAVEIEAIELILEDLDIPVTTYTSSFATEDNFKSCSSTSSPNILHVATHGFFFNKKLDEKKSTNNQEPIFRKSQNNMIRSGLILAGGNYCWKHGLAYDGAAEDGILTSYEISNLDFQNTDLVVLSACETGLGIIKDNEGVYGLQRAFKIAGANYIIMSLWQVPDFQSQELMTSFYYHWLEGKNSIPTAFRLAQQELKSKGHSTFDWAGFILIQ